MKSFENYFIAFCLLCSTSAWGQTAPLDPNSSNSQRDMATSAGALRSSTNGSSGSNAGGTIVQTDEFTGAVTYAVGIPLPPGRGAVTPTLALNYHSQRKNPNSWVGYGWDLDVGVISKSPSETGSLCDVATRDSDFEVRLVGQSETLKYIGDRSGHYLHSVGISREYQTVTAEFFQAKIEASFTEYYLIHAGTDTNRLDYWVAKDKNGLFYIFDQREYDPGASGVRSCISKWHLTTIVDPNNNFMQVHYDNVSGLIQNIEYQDIRVEFVTGFMGSEDAQKHYYPAFRESGVPQEQLAKVLNEVRIFSNSVLLQRFRLTYQVTPIRRMRQLVAVQQWGPTNTESLPAMRFDYYPETNPVFESRVQEYDAHNHITSDPKFSYLNATTSPQLTFADMNGDGFVDQLAAFEDHMEVYYNNGQNFVTTSESRWTQPFSCDFRLLDPTSGRFIYAEDNFCENKVTDSFTGDGEAQQRLFLIDLNGDALPDRVARIIVRNFNTPDETAYFRIAFNTGHGWGRVEEWEDPHHGYFTGLGSSHQGFQDMDGDGLVDRIVGGDGQDYFLVYYNNGAGFNSTPVRWTDPLASFHSDDRGKLYAADRHGNLYISIRDFNGDGLPDRIWKTVFYQGESDRIVGEGFSVSLNTGSYWAIPTLIGDRTRPDGFKNLAILDPATDSGMTNDRTDLIDMNADGYLDRVEGNEDTGTLRVWFYRGFQSGFSVTRFSDPIDISDPARVQGHLTTHYTSTTPVYPDSTSDIGFSYAGSISYSSGEGQIYRHTFLMDLNGDNFPDRLVVNQNLTRELPDPRSDRPVRYGYGTPYYSFYPMRVNSISMDGSPALASQVNQVPGLIKNVINEQGGQFSLEYQPTTYGWESLGVTDHRYLPFSLYVVRFLYTEDPTLDHSRPVFSLDVPSLWMGRYPGMRRTEYKFRGGSFFIRYAQKREPSNPASNELVRKRVSRFNGFHEVEKIMEPSLGEHWLPLKQTTFYAQALTDVFIGRHWMNPLLSSDTFHHYALSGKPYLVIAQEGSRIISREEFSYQLNTTSYDNYECNEDALTHSSLCYPRLEYHSKHFFESSGPERLNTAHYQYDSFGNIIRETHFGSRDVLVDVETQYYPAERFGSAEDTPLIKSRPSLQIKRGADGAIYRKKSFDYDGLGNSTEERLFLDESGSRSLVLSRRYEENGLLRSTTDIDGITKEIHYDAARIFPEEEVVIGPGSDRITTRRTFFRFTGNPISEASHLGLSKGKTVDAFGRTLTEWVRGLDGVTQTLKRIQYDFITTTVNNWPNIIVKKIQAWEFKPDYPSEIHPTSISYQAAGFSQQCSFSEHGNYRVIYAWSKGDGREEVKTDPQFSDTCDFSTTLPTRLTLYRTEKDTYDRVTYADAPPGDTNSPLGDVHVNYTTNSDGHLVKTMINPRGQSMSEEYDEKDRLLRKTDQLRTTMEYRFNAADDLTDVFQGTQRLTHIEYDLLGRKTEMQDNDMGTWKYFYDSHGRLDYQEDAAHQKIQNFYDDISRVWKKTFYKPDGSVEKYTTWTFDSGADGYNVRLGELYKVEEFRGDDSLLRRTRYSYGDTYRHATRVSRYIPLIGEFHQDTRYDVLGRLLETEYPGGEKIAQTYMRHGSLMQVCQNSCSGSRSEIYYRLDPESSFDVQGSLLKEFYGNGVEGHYDYYSNSKRLKNKKIISADKTFFDRSYSYDEMANVKTLSDNLHSQGNGALSDVTYDSLDRLTTFQYAGTTRSQRVDYDATGNILKNTASYGEALYQYTSPRPHAVTQIGDEHFDYDANGNMISDNYRHMDYNTDNQLIRVTMLNGDIVNYDYDFSGARVLKRVEKHLPDHRIERKVTHYLGDVMEIRDDQLVLNIYAAGRRVATKTAGRISTSSGAAGGTLVNHGIDPDLNGTQLMPYFIILMTLLILASVRPLPSLKNTRRDEFRPYIPIYNFWRSWSNIVLETLSEYPRKGWVKTFLLFMILLMQVQMMAVASADEGRPSPTASDAEYLYYNHDDHLGSSALLTEGKASARHSGLVYNRGDLLQRFEYAPFGRETFSLNPNLNFDPSYTGQHYDIETGLYYYKARYYNPILGRFIQPDTMTPDAKNLQDYNRYAYVKNNPLKYVDPSGHFVWGAFIFALALGAMLGAMSSAMTGGNILIGAIQGLISAAIFYGAGEVIHTVQITTQAARHLMARALVHAIAGAVSGALNAAISGGNLSQIGRSALVGGLSAGVAKGVGEPLEGLMNVEKANIFVRTLVRSSLGAATGAMSSALSGGSALRGAELGGATAAAGSLFNEGFEAQHSSEKSYFYVNNKYRISFFDKQIDLDFGVEVKWSGGFKSDDWFGYSVKSLSAAELPKNEYNFIRISSANVDIGFSKGSLFSSTDPKVINWSVTGDSDLNFKYNDFMKHQSIDVNMSHDFNPILYSRPR